MKKFVIIFLTLFIVSSCKSSDVESDTSGFVLAEKPDDKVIILENSNFIIKKNTNTVELVRGKGAESKHSCRAVLAERGVNRDNLRAQVDMKLEAKTYLIYSVHEHSFQGISFKFSDENGVIDYGFRILCTRQLKNTENALRLLNQSDYITVEKN